MDHFLFARIWQHLDGRRDTRHLVREIRGHYAFELAETTQELSGVLSKYITWFKVVFDIQRTYLQAPNPSRLSRELAIDSEDVVASVIFLLRKFNRLPYRSEGLLESLSICCLSALRLLQLLSIRARPRQHNRRPVSGIAEVKSTIAQWPVGHGRPYLERLQAKCLESLSLDMTQDDQQNDVDIPDPSDGLYPVSPLALHQLDLFKDAYLKGYRERFWSMFDIIWALEASIVRRCIDEEFTTSEVAKERCVVETLLKELGQKELGQRDYDGEILRSCLLQWCNPGCSCASGLGNKSRGIEDSEFSKPYVYEILELEKFLERRQGALLDAYLTRKSLTDVLTNSTQQWRSSLAEAEQRPDMVEKQLPLYVLRCPKLHILFASEMVNEIGFEPADLKPYMSELNKDCPKCRESAHFDVALRLDPLDEISARLDSLTPSQDTYEPPTSIPVSSGSVSRPVSGVSSSNDRVSSIGLAEPISGLTDVPQVQQEAERRPSSLESKMSFFSLRKENKRPTPISDPSLRPERISFTGDGKHLLVWNRSRNDYFLFASAQTPATEDQWLAAHNNGPPVKLDCRSIDEIAGEKTFTAFLSWNSYSQERRRTLFVSEKEQYYHISTIDEQIPLSFAVSATNKRIAVGFKDKIQLYSALASETGSDSSFIRTESRLENPEEGANKHIHSQTISFDSSGSRLIVGNHDGDKANLSVFIFDSANNALPLVSRFNTRMVLTRTSFFKISVLHNSSRNISFLAGFVDKPYYQLWHQSGHIGSPKALKAQSAVLCPNGKIAYCVDATGHFHKADLMSGSRGGFVKTAMKLTRQETVFKKQDCFELGMPSESQILVAWIDRSVVRVASRSESERDFTRWNIDLSGCPDTVHGD